MALKKGGFFRRWWPVLLGPVSILFTIPAIFMESPPGCIGPEMAYLIFMGPVIIICSSISVLYVIIRLIATYKKKTKWNNPGFYVVLFCYFFFMIFLFMRPSQVGSYNHAKITIGQVMDFFESEVNKSSDPGIVCDPVTFVG